MYGDRQGQARSGVLASFRGLVSPTVSSRMYESSELSEALAAPPSMALPKTSKLGGQSRYGHATPPTGAHGLYKSCGIATACTTDHNTSPRLASLTTAHITGAAVPPKCLTPYVYFTQTARTGSMPDNTSITGASTGSSTGSTNQGSSTSAPCTSNSGALSYHDRTKTGKPFYTAGCLSCLYARNGGPACSHAGH